MGKFNKEELQEFYSKPSETDEQIFSEQKDFCAQMLVYSYFIPSKNILFIINIDETRWGVINIDGSGVLDNILDDKNERYSVSFPKGTFTTAFNKAKEEYEKDINIWHNLDCDGIYPFVDEKLCTLGHEVTYLLLIEIKNSIKDKSMKNAW
jgi:hypothetical protein